MNLHFWVAITGMLAVGFGAAHIAGGTALWFGDWGSPEIKVQGSGARVQGALEVILGLFLLVGSALDYFGVLSFRPVMNVVKAFLEF
jgi:hypothetical protein